MRLALASVFVFSSFALVAQQPAPQATAAAPAPAKPAVQEAPKPGPEMAKLQPFIGSFRVDEHYEAGPWGAASQGAGFNHITAGPGGFSILINYTTLSGVMHGMKGHGVLGWDDGAKTYRQVWTDSMGPVIAESTGAWEGDTLVMRTDGTMMGKPYKEEDVFSNITPEGFTLTASFAFEGGPMAKMMTLNHHRLAAPAAPAAK